TTTNQVVVALSMLRQNRDLFDLVISDVHMPDMDGFKLLELVGLEMDLPVIMLSVNGETKTVMKGITHGACDYLLKPVRLEELRNIWQHVVRRKFSNYDRANIDGYEECNRPSNADFDLAHNQITAGPPDQSGRPSKKRKEYHSEDEDEGEESNGQDNDDPSAPKKPRVVWSVELHRKLTVSPTATYFKISPMSVPTFYRFNNLAKRILELMNVEGLTRENVASHLQKYKLYLKRLSDVASQHASIVASLGGNDPFMRISAFEGLHGYQSFEALDELAEFATYDGEDHAAHNTQQFNKNEQYILSSIQFILSSTNTQIYNVLISLKLLEKLSEKYVDIAVGTKTPWLDPISGKMHLNLFLLIMSNLYLPHPQDPEVLIKRKIDDDVEQDDPGQQEYGEHKYTTFTSVIIFTGTKSFQFNVNPIGTTIVHHFLANYPNHLQALANMNT
ncbi:hypothetical protein ACJX0J_042338, partial [Zea mays]